ncbi:hypothetical protein [Kitasatospora sp. NPDC057541]|uniref:terminase gpP N-terminus-related DNA-binding protein n=1 Tax=Kitasatospora sp. NPDC057541 TaxID=3346161 RepID=UPI0036ACAC78
MEFDLFGALMLTREEDVDAHALRRQGWSISAIARHLGRDRKTVRAYLAGERVAGVRAPALDEFVPFLPHCRQRLADDPHLWATRLFDEVIDLGYHGGYSTFTRPFASTRSDHIADHATAVPGGTAQSSSTRRARRSSSTGWSCPTRPSTGASGRTPTCWSVRSLTRDDGAGCWPRARTSRTWSRRWTKSCGGCTVPDGAGGSTAWRRSAIRPAGS